MELTATGAGILLIALFVMIRDRQGLLYLLAFFLPFASTAIINLTSMTFSATPYHVFGGLLIVVAALRWTSRKITSEHLDVGSPFLAFVATLFASMFQLALYKGIGLGVVLQTAILMLGFFVGWAVAESIHSVEIARKVVLIYLWGGLFTAVWGVFQWACLNFGLPYPDSNFNNSISESAALFDQTLKQTTYLVYRVSSVSSEPSSVARFLVAVLIIAIVQIGEGVGRVPFGRWYLYVVSGVIALTTSSTGLLGLIMVFSLTLVLYGRVFLRDIMVMGISGLFILLASPKIAQIVASVTIDKGDTGSYDIRMESMLYGYRAFVQAPFFGHGWGWFKGNPELAMVNDLIFKFLSSVGVFGFSLFLIFCGLGVLGAWKSVVDIGLRLRSPGLSDEEQETGRFMRAVTFRFMLAFIVCFLLDVVASFFYYAGNFWFMFGSMVGLSRVASAWVAAHELPRAFRPAMWRRAEAG